MKIKFTYIILLFSCQFFCQTNLDLNQKFDKINSHVKFIDSLSNYIEEKNLYGVIRTSQGRNDGKPVRELFTNTQITKSANQIIRICHRERYADYDEDLNLYFFENKLIYAERSRWKGKRNRFSMEKFYFENDIQISRENSKKYPKTGIDILIRAEELIKQASR